MRRPPREGLELELMKMGRTGPPLEPRRRPQAGKSGYPHSQNADTLSILIEQTSDAVDVNFISQNNFNNNAYRGNFNPRPFS